MSVPFSNTKLRVPQGFQTLLESLTREILRNKPANIYEFSAGYLEHLVNEKKEGRLDDILKQTLLDDRLHNNHSFKDSYSLNNKNIESAAVIIQSSFRGHQTRESLDSQRTAEHKPEVVAEKPAVQKTEHVEKAAEPVVHSQTNDVIPSVVHDSNKQESHSKDIQSEEASIHEFNNDVQLQRRAKSPNENETLKREEDVNIAATIIQSTFRGYKTRKELEGKGNQQESNNAYINEENNGENLANDDDDDVRNEAATKIQATFRGFQTRRTLNESQKKPE